jgi:enterochelin esterase-like enzyme
MPTAFIVTGVVAALIAGQPAAKYDAQGPEKKDGFETYVVTSAYQEKPCKLGVLLPDRFDKTKKYKVLFLLPAWAPSMDGLKEAKKLDLANKHDIICVGPDFASMPWYVDHPEKPKVRYDSYLPDVIVPFIDKTYPTLAKPEGRLLVGFSKSGLGAVSLLLRHPDVFGRAGSWDGILIMDNRPEFYGSNRHYLANYHIPTLLNKRAAMLKDQPARLAITGYGIPSFQKSTEDVHKLLQKLEIPHYFDNSSQRRHEWQSGWLGPLVEVLLADDMAKAVPKSRK